MMNSVYLSLPNGDVKKPHEHHENPSQKDAFCKPFRETLCSGLSRRMRPGTGVKENLDRIGGPEMSEAQRRKTKK